ncbi:unnamed protein product [Musa acuminata subsp. burmannicoides]
MSRRILLVIGLMAWTFVRVTMAQLLKVLIGVAMLMAAVGVFMVWNWTTGRKKIEKSTSIDNRNTPLEKLVKIIGVIVFFYFLWILLQRFAFYLLVNVVCSLFL